MKLIKSEELKQMESRYRARLVNSLSGIKSANLIGTIDGKGNENLSIVSSCFHLGSDPALMGVIFRPAIVERHTFENILEKGIFTLNHVNDSIFEQAHQTSARYKREETDFEKTGMTSLFIENFGAPFVAEANIQIGLNFRKNVHLEVNKTELVIGEISIIRMKEELIMPDGFVDLVGAKSVGVTGLDCYHKIIEGERLSYAKPDRPVKKLTKEGSS